MTRVNQHRTNPSQAISNFKGRWDSVFGWPSTAISTWFNGGLFASGVDWAYGTGGDTTASVTIDGVDWRYHIFNSSGTFDPTDGNTTYGGRYPAYIEVFVAAGGGGGGGQKAHSSWPASNAPGGGGAGGAYIWTVDEDAPEGTGMLLANHTDSVAIVVGAGGTGGRWNTMGTAGATSSVIQASATPTTRKTAGGGSAGQGVYDPSGSNIGGPGNNSSNFHPDYTNAGSGGGQAGGAVRSDYTMYSHGGVGGNRTAYGDTNVVPFAGNNGGHGGGGFGSSNNAYGAAGGSAVNPPQTGSSNTYSSLGLSHNWTGSLTYYACGGAGLAYDGSSYGTSDNIGDSNWDAVTGQSVSSGTGSAPPANTGSGGGGNYGSTAATHNQGATGTVWIRYKV